MTNGIPIFPSLEKDIAVKERNSVDILNFLRVIATMFVFLLHGRSYVGGVSDAPEFFAMITNFPAWAGVWILFFLSGYLIQKGFISGKYNIYEKTKFNVKELLKFYLKRFLRIAPTYYIYIFLLMLLCSKDFFTTPPETITDILTFTFNGEGSISGTGHLWYISIAVWLYVFAPFFSFLISKLKKTGILSFVFAFVMILGRLVRQSFNYAIENGIQIEEIELNWYDHVYTALPMNFDFFICGMLMCSITFKLKDKIPHILQIIMKAISLCSFFLLAYYNTYIYRNEEYFIYRYVLPTVYILICAFLVLSFDTQSIRRSKPTWKAVLRNPLRLIDKFSPLTYPFYIFHIMSFHMTKNYLALWEDYANMDIYMRYTIFFIISFSISLLAAYLFTKMTEPFNLKNHQNSKKT